MSAIATRTPRPPQPPLRRAPAVDEAAARRTLRDQIGRLEDELGALVVSTWPGTTPVTPVGAPRTAPGLLTLAELERVRDALAERAQDARRTLDERGRVEEQFRRAREEILLDPGRHAWQRISNADVGDPGCRHWHAVPRFGLLGMLAGWWRVKISSGCPLPGAAPRRRAWRDH
jgi:hypothetical protein